MNQKEKRQRINRIRNKQKKVRKAKRPKAPRKVTREDLADLLSMTKRFMRSEQNLIFLREERLKSLMKSGIISVFVFVFFFLMVIFKIFYVSSEWVSQVLTAVFMLCMIPWIEYFFQKDWLLLSHWKKELKENSEFAKDLEEQLQKTG